MELSHNANIVSIVNKYILALSFGVRNLKRHANGKNSFLINSVNRLVNEKISKLFHFLLIWN